MTRLIDAERLKDAITIDYYEHFTSSHDTDQIALIEMVCDDIDESSAIDPVRAAGGCYCKECKFRCVGKNEAESWCYCKVTNHNIELTDFCSWGQQEKGELK